MAIACYGGRSVVVWIRTRGTRGGWGNEGECLVVKRVSVWC